MDVEVIANPHEGGTAWIRVDPAERRLVTLVSNDQRVRPGGRIRLTPTVSPGPGHEGDRVELRGSEEDASSPFVRRRV